MKRAEVISYLDNLLKSKKLSWFEKQQIKQGCLMLKYLNTNKNEFFYKSKRLGEKTHGLSYCDLFITMFSDLEHCQVVLVNDIGTSKVINFDDNFFYVECLLDAYLELILDSSKKWAIQTRELKIYVNKFYKELCKDNEIDLSLASEEVRALIKD